MSSNCACCSQKKGERNRQRLDIEFADIPQTRKSYKRFSLLPLWGNPFSMARKRPAKSGYWSCEWSSHSLPCSSSCAYAIERESIRSTSSLSLRSLSLSVCCHISSDHSEYGSCLSCLHQDDMTAIPDG